MAFLAPGALILSILLPVILAMYLLKLRRTEQEVASIYLWQRMVQDIEANAPWQKLKSNVLLFLQLLIVAALVLALARPFTWGEGSQGDLLILVIDASASMQATDVSPSRIEAARVEARRLINGLPPSARVTIIEAGQRAELRLAGSLDRAAANQALNNLQAGLGGADLENALALASAAAAGRMDADIVLLTDGGTTLDPGIRFPGRFRTIMVGDNDDNQAIELFTLEQTPGGDYTAFVRVVNHASQPVTRRLTLSANGVALNAFDLRLEPGEGQSVVAERISAEVLEAQLVGEDALALDDHAWAVAGNARTVTIELVSAGNLFLEAALALMPGVEFSLIAPEDYAASEDGNQATDLTVFDGLVPPELPAGALLFIGPGNSSPYFEVGPIVDDPQPRILEAGEPILRYVDLGQVEILDAVNLQLPAWGRPLVVGETDQGSIPLLATIEEDNVRVAVIGFDLRRSDLPLQTAYPILMANLIAWLVPQAGGGLPDQVQAGDVLIYTPEVQVSRVTLIRPDGSRLGLDVVDGRVQIEETHQLGLYQIETSEGRIARYVVNLSAPDESDVTPGSVQLSETDSDDAQVEVSGLSRYEWWPWLAGLAVIVLMIEWLVYQRAAVARVISWVRHWRANG